MSSSPVPRAHIYICDCLCAAIFVYNRFLTLFGEDFLEKNFFFFLAPFEALCNAAFLIALAFTPTAALYANFATARPRTFTFIFALADFSLKFAFCNTVLRARM